MPGGLTQPPMPRRPPPPLPLSPEALEKLKTTGAPPAPPPLPPRPRRPPPPLPAPLGPEALAELEAEMQAPTRPRSRHVRGGAPLPGPEALAELAAEMQSAPPAPGPGSDVALVNPEIFSALERYKQADRGAVRKGLGRLFSTRPGAAAIAPTTPATLQQLQAAGHTIRLVSQVADLSARIAALDVEIAGATKSQQDAAGNRARAAVWEKSGVPVDMRPLRSGVLGAEIASNQAAFQEERLKARALAQAQADKVSKDQLTKERAKKASLPESDAGEEAPGFSLLGMLGGLAPEISLNTGLTGLNAGVQAAYKGWAKWGSGSDALVRDLGISANALGSALSIMTAAMHLKTAMMHGLAAESLSDIGKDERDMDRARDVMTQGAAEITAFKASIAAGKSMGSTLSAMGGFLVATPAGPILKIIGTAITGAAIVTDVTKDSYQAGKVVEKEFEARYHGDAEESAEYVLRYGAEHRAESLLRKGRGNDAAALKALAIYNITPADLETTPTSELRAKIIKHQGVATKNIGMKLSEGVSGVGEYFSDSGGGIIQHYRADIAERTARAKDLMGYGTKHNLTKVRAAAFFRTGSQVDSERKAQLEILKLKIERNSHGLDPATLEKVKQLLQPQAYYQQLKADHARKLRNIQMFGPGTSISAPIQAGAAPS
ncbi:MAG: hypothetical protein Q8K79_08250 [Solirubrobacteraceae bacterium]|nr:hypothetical protein [Solirubrobacteraceae bacterium]